MCCGLCRHRPPSTVAHPNPKPPNQISGPPNCPTQDGGRGLLGACLRLLRDKEKALRQQLQERHGGEGGHDGGDGDGGRQQQDGNGGGGGGLVGLAARALAAVWNARW